MVSPASTPLTTEKFTISATTSSSDANWALTRPPAPRLSPFIVLTGANMPAVLSEISFVSNASDESLLFETAQRQRIAEGLYRGVASYLDRMPGTALRAKRKLLGENHVLASPRFQ